MSAVLPELLLRDRVERRVLAALRCVDGTTGAPLARTLRLQAPANARVERNRSGWFVVHEWAPLSHHSAAFDTPPAAPAPGSLRLPLSLSDPSGHYLPRRVALALPRNADAGLAGSDDSLFTPVDVPLYPAGVAALGANWAALRVSLHEAVGGDALGGALLRVVAAGQVIARGLSDWRGEALVPVAGIPVTTWSAGPGDVVVTQIDATLEAFFDPASGVRTSRADVLSGHYPNPLPLVDPAAIEEARAGLPQAGAAISLAAGRPLHLSLGINVP